MTPTATGVPFFLVRRAAPGGFVETPFDDGRGSVLAGGRYSYTGLLVPLFAKDTRIGYWDYQARASYDLSAREKVSVFAFGSNDNLEQRDNATGNFRRTFATEFHRVDVRYDRTLGSTGKLRLAATLGYDTFRDDTSEVSDALVGLRAVAEGDIVRGAKLRGGADAELHSYGLAHPPATLFALDETTLYATNVLYPPHNDATFGAYADVVLRVSPRLLAIGIEPILTASRGCGRRQADRGIGACGRIRPSRFSTACEKIVNRRRCASRSRSFIAAKSAAAAALVCGSVLPVPKECVVDDEANRHDNHEGEPADEDADRNVPENDDRARERHGISSSLTSSLQRRSVCSFESHATSWPLACEPGHCAMRFTRDVGALLHHVPEIVEVRGLGLMIGIELIDAAAVASVRNRALAQGLLVLSCGTKDEVLRVMPPLTISERRARYRSWYIGNVLDGEGSLTTCAARAAARASSITRPSSSR